MKKEIETDNGTWNLCGRYCSHCGEFKEWSEYYVDYRQLSGFSIFCKECAEFKRGRIRNNIKNIRFDGKGKICTRCNTYKLVEYFDKTRRSSDGYNCWCKDCKRAYKGATKRKEYIIDNFGRQCIRCGEYKLWNNFGKDNNRPNGHKSWCIKCHNEHAAEYRKTNHKEVLNRINEHRVKGATFKTYAHQLTVDEECREGVRGELLVKCANHKCNKYFNPTNGQVQIRLNVLLGRASGEGKLYCSEECKTSCPVYNNRINSRKDPTSLQPIQPLAREFSREFRKMILERDANTCQLCGESNIKKLIAHHITPYKISPMEALDIDNGITLCKECHTKVHSLPGCTLQELAGLTCEHTKKSKELLENIEEEFRYWVKTT